MARARRDWRTFYALEDRSHETACWVWRGAMWTTGYAKQVIDGRFCRVHRLMYEERVGPIGEGMHIHHLCGVKSCINPQHLQQLTPREHFAEHPREGFARPTYDVTHCPRGHAYDDANTYRHPARGCRSCRTCAREKSRERPRKTARRVREELKK